MDFVDIGLWTTAILLGIAIAAAVIMPLINSLSDPKSLLKSGMGLGILAIIFLIAWGASTNEVTANYISYNVTSETASQLIGGGLLMMYILFGIGLVGVVISEIHKAIKS